MFTGIISFRSPSSGACSDSANVTGISSIASLLMPGTRPTVEIVIRRADMPSPDGPGSTKRRTAFMTRL